ncbi:hypothetical protein D3C72_1432580 [compost metagenome]
MALCGRTGMIGVSHCPVRHHEAHPRNPPGASRNPHPPPRHPRPSRTLLRRTAHRQSGRKKLGIVGHRGPSRAWHDGARRRDPQRQQRPLDRPARRHGRAAAAGSQYLRPSLAACGQDACMRPRRAYRDAARRGALPCAAQALRWHRSPALPAGRGRRRRRARNDQGRTVLPFSLRCGIRRPQLARHAGRRLRHARGPADGIEQ